MSSRDGVHWHCSNRDCNWSFVATMPGEEEEAPRCVCGSVMEKGETVPAFQYLDFLREETMVEEEAGVEKE